MHDSALHDRIAVELLCKMSSWLLVAPSAAPPSALSSLERIVAAQRSVLAAATRPLIETVQIESETTHARAAIAARERTAAALSENAQVRAENAALQLELDLLRHPTPKPLPSVQPFFSKAVTEQAAEAEQRARRAAFLLYRKHSDSASWLRICFQLSDESLVHSKIGSRSLPTARTRARARAKSQRSTSCCLTACRCRHRATRRI